MDSLIYAILDVLFPAWSIFGLVTLTTYQGLEVPAAV